MKRRMLLGSIGNYPINTIIGGIASAVNTKSALATKLGVSESIIRRFEIVGSDVQFNLSRSYSIVSNAFYNDLNITKYLDLQGLCTAINISVFHNASNMTEAYFPGSVFIGTNAFWNATKLNNLFIENASSVGSGSLRNTGLEEIKITSNITINSNQIWQNNSKLKRLIIPNIKGNIINDSINNIPLLEVLQADNIEIMGSGNFFSNFPLLPIVNLPSLKSISFNNFRNYTSLQQVYLPNLTQVAVRTYVFAGLSSCTKISIKKLKTMPSYSNRSNMFENLKTGCVIEANIFLATANAGAVDDGLLYAKNTRGAIVEFYDDNGNYVSTL